MILGSDVEQEDDEQAKGSGVIPKAPAHRHCSRSRTRSKSKSASPSPLDGDELLDDDTFGREFEFIDNRSPLCELS